MSEEILQALMELFALISKQDDGTSEAERVYVETFLRKQLNARDVQNYINQFDKHAGLNSDKPKKKRRISMLDSVKTVRVCEKINEKLVLRQKYISIVRLFELLLNSGGITEQKHELIYTASDIFNIKKESINEIEYFVFGNFPKDKGFKNVLLLADESEVISEANTFKYKVVPGISGKLSFLRVGNADLYFLKYQGDSELSLNGLRIDKSAIHLFANGSNLKLSKGSPLYYSDIVSHFLQDQAVAKISFDVRDLTYRFKNGNIGLHPVQLKETQGNLIGIMGASGAGKTTLLNLLLGNLNPTSGSITLNGIDINKSKSDIDGVFGYIPQDDLLFEDLSVYQNLYYNTKLCFDNLTEVEIQAKVSETLKQLGLLEIKDLKVGSPLNKTISGGQRKRLNIALELIREPSILFVDEPTSGLSSRDSENVMDLLRELSLKGKLIFVVIHQPSSDIYKMFDRVSILDTGGYQIYYGNPIEAVTYYKRLDHQINSDIAECPNCGNVNPEAIFNIIEAKVVDEYGNFTDERKVSPAQWYEYFTEQIDLGDLDVVEQKPEVNLNLPTVLNQFKIFSARDLLAKLGNFQYVIINLIEAPLLTFFLAFIVKYSENPETGDYIFRENDNVPSYFFMSIIMSMFIGLTVSAEEIFRDRKILKREEFLKLSRTSYLMSKIGILFTISAIQCLLVIIVGNSILEIEGMFIACWLTIFSIFCFANILGLNISSTFNSAVTIYILIPLIIIPQMILGGAMFSYNKLNSWVGGGYGVPSIAELMPSRWAYEGLMVNQFKNNEWEQGYFDLDIAESNFDYKIAYFIPELEKRLDWCKKNINSNEDSIQNLLQNKLSVIRNEIEKENEKSEINFNYVDELEITEFDQSTAGHVKVYLELLNTYYLLKYDTVSQIKENTLVAHNDRDGSKSLELMRNKYSNNYVTDIVKGVLYSHQIIEKNGALVRVVDPIFNNDNKHYILGIGSHFFAPFKYLFGKLKFETIHFNIIVIWLMNIALFFTLYFNIFYKVLGLFQKLGKKEK
jgi:ABC-type multidrug transport system ATPase subunit